MARNRPDITAPARVRFAPSPTGSLHVGGARTALFNWLIARNTGGTFVLRLEDTDRERSTPESEAEILRCLAWLGLDWDEGPFRQSERDDVYAAAVERLKAAGAIYPAYETDEELEAQRAAARADKRAPVVRGRRDRDPAEIAELEAAGRRPVWRFAVDPGGETTIEDYVRGTVRFGHGAIEDFVVARSDGTPTYNLAAAVDDLEMGITHVVRGEDHISNTPKQMMVIRALGGQTPDYAHIPLILGEDKKRLSKRHGAASVEDLEAAGFLPRAAINALALLGWSFDDKTTMFTVDELVEKFSITRVSKSPAIFDMKKLKVINGRHLRLMANDEFTDALAGWLRSTGYLDGKGPEAEELVRASAPLVKRKISTFAEYDDLAGWLFRPLEIEPEAWETLTRDVRHSIQVIGGGLGRLEQLPEWTVEAIKEALQDQLHIMGEAARDFLEPQRIAITGRTVSTGTYESLALLGREESFRRYRETLAKLAELWAAA
ncbi:glutamate--tRNA ligase [Miltoncostaea marina]|uniref:glutamate--tRNA ligase n=1 Tax=Miltoncostaea marina TaxID=2843215 RepID=UPI001C3D1811|nr:glutamate--tRNA ligase [Miltoncostaea marina]